MGGNVYQGLTARQNVLELRGVKKKTGSGGLAGAANSQFASPEDVEMKQPASSYARTRDSYLRDFLPRLLCLSVSGKT
jgi:hypothetical protein